MVTKPEAGGVKRLAFLALALAVALGGARAQAQLTLEQVGSRQPPQYTPTHAGQQVTVQGVVSARPFRFPGYVLLAFEEAGHGAMLEAPEGSQAIDGFVP